MLTQPNTQAAALPLFFADLLHMIPTMAVMVITAVPADRVAGADAPFNEKDFFISKGRVHHDPALLLLKKKRR
jgi:hypothetical protein